MTFPIFTFKLIIIKYIQKDVFDKRAVEKNQVVFNDVSYIEENFE